MLGRYLLRGIMKDQSLDTVDIEDGHAEDDWLPLVVTKIVEESAVIKSFYLRALDGRPVRPRAAGQHLPIRFLIPGDPSPTIRTYTISSDPSADGYRISVRKLGTGSSYLHDAINVGDMIEARAPAGAFTIDAEQQHPVVLIAAGVGVTPMIAMLGHLVVEAERTGRMRPVTMFYAARSKAERAFDGELAALGARAPLPIRFVRLLQLTDDALEGPDFEERDTIHADLFRKYLGFDRYDFFLCGPPGFMQAVYGMLRDLGVADDRIFAEAFGPASLSRTPDSSGAPAAAPAQPADGPVRVVFNQRGAEAIWSPGQGSLLEFAEASGLTPEFGCREGACGACRTKLVSGRVAKLRETSALHAADEVLLCSSVPARAALGEANELVLAIR